MRTYAAVVCLVLSVYLSHAQGAVVELPLSELKITSVPGEAITAAPEARDGGEQLRVKIKVCQGWPQIKIALPADLDRTAYTRVILRIKLIGPYQAYALAFLARDGRTVNGGRYFYKDLRQGEYVDSAFWLAPEEMRLTEILQLCASNPAVDSEFLIDAIFLASDKAVIPNRWAREQAAYAAQAISRVQSTEAAVRIINGKEYRLAWTDEFDGAATDRWSDRVRGHGYANCFQPGDGHAAFADGAGNMVLPLAAYPKAKVLGMVKTQAERDQLAKDERPYVPTLAQIWTNDSFLYGYHEMRFKLPVVPGLGLYLCYFGNKGTVDEVEIDVLEQSLFSKGKIVDYKSSTIHWYSRPANAPEGQALDYREVEKNGHNYESYQFQRLDNDREEAKRLAGLGKDPAAAQAAEVELLSAQTQAKLGGPLTAFNILDNSTNGLTRKVYIVEDNRHRWDDGEWHTASFLWSKDAYSFFYDGEFVGRIEHGLLHSPVQAILGLRVFEGWDGEIVKSGKGDDVKTTPGRVLVDYYRVYQGAGDADVVVPRKP